MVTVAESRAAMFPTISKRCKACKFGSCWSPDYAICTCTNPDAGGHYGHLVHPYFGCEHWHGSLPIEDAGEKQG